MQIKDVEDIKDMADVELKLVDKSLCVYGTVDSGIGDYFAILAFVQDDTARDRLKAVGWEECEKYGEMCMMKRSERFDAKE